MAIIRVNYKEIEALRYGVLVGYGKEGRCYFQEDDNLLVKLFHYFIKDRQIYFSYLKDARISFPVDILKYEDTESVVGYTLPFLQGESLKDGFKMDTSLEKLKESFLELKELINKYKDIYMNDICLDNIFYDYDKNQFNLIDTSRWYPKVNGYRENLSNINWIFIAGLTESLDLKHNRLSEDEFFNKLYKIYYQYKLEIIKKNNKMKYQDMNIDGLFLDILNNLIENGSRLSDHEVKTIKELVIK